MKLTPDVLKLDPKKAADAIAETLRETVVGTLKRRGVVVGLSGGIDSSVTAGLAVRALGKQHVFGLLMPDTDSADETLGLSRSVAAALGIDTVHEDITPILSAARCYEQRIGSLQVIEPSVLGVQVAYAGYFQVSVLVAAAVIKLTA